MAGGVFVEQGVVKEQAAAIDGRIVRDERALAQVRRAFVRFDQALQLRLPFRRVHLDRLTMRKTHGKVADELPLIGERLGGIHHTLRLAAHGRGEHLFGGDVGVEGYAGEGRLFAGGEQPLPQQPHLQAGAVGTFIFEGSQPQRIEVRTARGEVLVVRLPVGERIPLQRARTLQDRPPQLVFRERGVGGAREYLFRPGGTGDSGDAPLVFVFHLVAVGLEHLRPRPHGAGVFGAVDALQAVGVGAFQIQAGGQLAQAAAHLLLFPRLHGGHDLFAAVFGAQAHERPVRPLHAHLGSAGAVAFFRDQSDEFGLVELGGDDHLLPFLHVQPRARQQFGIIFENRFLHRLTL